MDICTRLKPPPIPAYVDVINYGGFVTQFKVDYIFQGIRRFFSSDVFLIGGERRIIVPKEAGSVHVQILIGPFSPILGTVYENTFDSAGEYCFVTYGVLFAPFCSKIDCISPG